MEEDSGGEIVEAVITCNGELTDPSFKKNFGSLLRRLKKRITVGFGKGSDLVVTKMEPWNSVRVTFSIPREAALRLRQLAQQGDATLRSLGILTVQVEGDQVISLTLAGRNNGPPQEITLRTEQAGPSSAPQRSLAELMAGAGERPPPPPPPAAAPPPTFRSPNVVAPVSQALPYSAKLQQRSGTATYPFSSMSAAAAVGHRELAPPPPPPPYPGPGQQQQQAAPPPPPAVPPQPATGGPAREAPPLKSPALSSMGSPLLVNLLKTESSAAEAAPHRAQHVPQPSAARLPQQQVRLNLQQRAAPAGQQVRRSPVGVPARVPSPAGLAQAAAARHSPVQLPLRVSPVQLPGSPAARPPGPAVTRPHPTRVAFVSRPGQHHVTMAHGGQPVGNGGLLVVNNGPARPGHQPGRAYSGHIKQGRPALQHVLPGTPRPQRPESAPRPPGISSAAASPSPAQIRPGPAVTSPPAKAHLSPGSSQCGASGKPRQMLINPLTGLLEPMPTSDSSSDSEPEPARSPFPENSNSIFSDEESNQSLPNMSDSEASKLSQLSGTSEGRRATPSPRPISTSPAAEKIKLRLKLEKAEPVSPVSPTYKVDVSFGGRRPDRAAGNGAPPSVGVPSGGEEPRVPPLHISLRGRNAAVVVSKDGGAAKSKDKLKPKLKSTKEREEAPAEGPLTPADEAPLKLKLKDPALKARPKEKDKVKRVKRKEDASDKGVGGVKVAKTCDKDGPSVVPPPKEPSLVNHVFGLHDELDLKHIPPVPPEDIFSPDPWEPRPAPPPPPPPPAAATPLALTAPLAAQKPSPAVTVATVTCLQPASSAALESALRAGRAEGDALRKEVLTHCLEKKVNDVCATTAASAVRLGDVLGCTALALAKVEGLADSPSVTPKGDPSNGQGEDSGIESMDTQSEKSPNQEESPHRKEELDSEKHDPAASQSHKTESVPVTDQPSERVPSRTFKTESIPVTVNTHNSSVSVCPAASVSSANPTSVSGDDKVQVVNKVTKREESVISASSNPLERRAESAAPKPPPEPSGGGPRTAEPPLAKSVLVDRPPLPPTVPANSAPGPRLPNAAPTVPLVKPEKPAVTAAGKAPAAAPGAVTRTPPADKPPQPAETRSAPVDTVSAPAEKGPAAADKAPTPVDRLAERLLAAKAQALAEKPAAADASQPPAVPNKGPPVPNKASPVCRTPELTPGRPAAAQTRPPPAAEAEPAAEKTGSGHARRVNNINNIVAKLQRCSESSADLSSSVKFSAAQGVKVSAPAAGRVTSDLAKVMKSTSAAPAAVTAPAAPVVTAPPAVSAAPAAPGAVALAKEAPAKPTDPPAEARKRPEQATSSAAAATVTTPTESRQDAAPPATPTSTATSAASTVTSSDARPPAEEAKQQAAAAATTGRTTPLNLPPGSKMLPIKLIKAVTPGPRQGAGSPLRRPERQPSPEPPVLSPAASDETRPAGVRRSDSKELPPELEQPSAEEPELLRVKPPLYTYSNPEKARETPPPTGPDSHGEPAGVDPSRLLKEILLQKEAVSKVESDHSYLRPGRRSLEELSIQIPDPEAEERRSTRCTRANSRLHSPTVASQTPARASPVSRAGGGKRRRFESGGSGAGGGEEPPDGEAGQERSRRRCSENAAGLIKACMGMDEPRPRPGTPSSTPGRRDEPRRVRTAAARKEEASDDESDRRSTRSTDESRVPSRGAPRTNHTASSPSPAAPVAPASTAPAPAPATATPSAAAAAKSDDKLSQERSTGRASRSRSRDTKASSRPGSAESLDGGAARKGRPPAKAREQPERETAAAAGKRKLRNSAAGTPDGDAAAAKRRRLSRDK